MDKAGVDRLDRKIHEVLESLATLRKEKVTLQNELKELRDQLLIREQEVEVQEKSREKDAVPSELAELQRLRKERALVRSKIVNVLKRIEGIQWGDEKVQQDLFRVE